MSPIPSTDLELGINQALRKVPLKFLIYDYGLSLEHAVRIAKDGNLVRYFTPYAKAFPQFEDFVPGIGLEGIEKVKHFFDEIDWADVIMFPDIGADDLCAYLRKTTNKPVYGAGKGEILENNRFYARQIQQKIGLPTQRTERVKGITQLKERLKGAKNKYVKLDIFRGDIDSFYVRNYGDAEQIYKKIDYIFGPFSEEYHFIIEDEVKGLEPGLDLFFNGNEFLKPYLYGYEHDKACYIGIYTNELPAVFQPIIEKLTPVLREFDYRGAISIEAKIPNPNEAYIIDYCCRFPFPLSAVYTGVLENYSDIIYNIANKKFIELEPKAKYVACLPLSSSVAEKDWVKLIFDEKLREKVKFRVACKVKNSYYGVKGHSWVYVLITWGENISQMIEELSKLADRVDAVGIEKDVVGGLNLIKEDIKKGEKFGLTFF